MVRRRLQDAEMQLVMNPRSCYLRSPFHRLSPAPVPCKLGSISQTMAIRNRIIHFQPDYILAIVRRPSGWHPPRIDAVPPGQEIVSKDYVASYEEAYDDLVRSNHLSLERGLDTWAMIQSPEASL
jgi:hypothetical protein